MYSFVEKNRNLTNLSNLKEKIPNKANTFNEIGTLNLNHYGVFSKDPIGFDHTLKLTLIFISMPCVTCVAVQN